jgi:hypothetical protein
MVQVILILAVKETYFEINNLDLRRVHLPPGFCFWGFGRFSFFKPPFLPRKLERERILNSPVFAKNIFLAAESWHKCFQETSTLFCAPRKGDSGEPSELSMSQG